MRTGIASVALALALAACGGEGHTLAGTFILFGSPEQGGYHNISEGTQVTVRDQDDKSESVSSSSWKVATARPPATRSQSMTCPMPSSIASK